MTIRVASAEDHEYLLHLAMQFVGNTAYKDMADEDTISDFIWGLLAPEKAADAIVLVAEGGMLWGMAAPFVYGKCKVATELAWWVEPEFRKSGLGKELLDAFEYWALKVGCQAVVMAGLDTDITKYYEKRGYTPREYLYMKEFI